MTSLEISRLENALRGVLNGMIVIRKSGRDPDLAEFEMGGETLGTVHRDIEDGEVSFHIHIVILGEDLEREPSSLPGSPAFKGGWAPRK